MLDKLVRVEGVGCCGLGQNYFPRRCHSRAWKACAVAAVLEMFTGSLVYTYQGDGVASIGHNETVSAANRGKFTVILSITVFTE